jgi:mono/diheme cytochrome c family protein
MRPVILVLLLIAIAGCQAKGSTPGGSATPSSATSATVSKYDSGPRAGEQPIDETLAKTGEQLFKDKGCSACHAFGTRLSGPDLAGVSMRRTAQWMENQILHPDVMVKEDPISRQLMATHALQMPNQGLTAEQAKSVIEYLKHRDHEASEESKSADEDASREGEGS